VEKTNLNSFFEKKNIGLLIAISIVVIFFIMGSWWILHTKFVPLSKQSSEIDQTRIIMALNEGSITYRIGQDGIVEVSEQDLNRAKNQLAQLGIINHPVTGYELLDKSSYGISEFSQKINYQRALEGELARSIMEMQEVKYARVHITFKKDSIYQTHQEPAKASVIVAMHPNILLTSSQVNGIQQLVASSVPSLSI